MEMTRSEMMITFKKLFEIQRTDILATHELVDSDLELSKDDMLDEVDLTSVEMATAMKTRLKSRELLFLKKIEGALGRIRNGSFGICESCSEDIELRRLEARPTATLCVNCKEEQERLEHNHIDSRRSKSLATLRLA